MESDWWLFRAFLFGDIAVVAFTLLLLCYTFPRRIRSGMIKNGIRLDGSTSKRRRAREHREFLSLMSRVGAVILTILVIANAVMYLSHRHFMPLPVAGAAMQEFHWKKLTWEERLNSPALGNISGQYEEWQQSGNGDHKSKLADQISMLPAAIVVSCLNFLVASFIFSQLYVRALERLEKRIRHRHREYLVHDMKGRFRAVEKSAERPGAAASP